MEDLFVEELPKNLRFGNKDIMQAIIDIEQCIQSERRNDFKFLCAVRSLIKESTHGNLILNGDVSLLKYSWLGDKVQLLEFLQKQFGFSQKYLERITRVILKFICVNSQDFKVLGYKFGFCNNLTISKMQELIGLSDYQLQVAFSSGDLTVKSTQKDIQDYVNVGHLEPADAIKMISKGTRPYNSYFSLSVEFDMSQSTESQMENYLSILGIEDGIADINPGAPGSPGGVVILW